MERRPDFQTARAEKLQKRLAEKVSRRDRIGPVRLLAGVDVSFVGPHGRAAVVVLDGKSLEPVETRTAEGAVRVPYIPGFLAFRELPLIRRAFRRLSRLPDLVMVDGMGTLHPRRFGLACHLGVELDLPCLGCAKNPYIGEYHEPRRERGSWSPVIHQNERVGAAVRTRDGVSVVFISTGHRISLRTAIRWALRASPEFRLPQPIRLAHLAAGMGGIRKRL